MKIVKATNLYEEVELVTTDGTFYLLAKRLWLKFGASGLYAYRNEPAPRGTRTFELEGGTIYNAVSDPVLLCLARRGWTLRGELSRVNVEMEVPTLKEAEAEMASNKDKFGGEWAAPIIPAVRYSGGVE